MQKPISVWDRVVYGAISGLFGSLLGLGAALCLYFIFYDSLSVRWMVLISAVYFFVIGAIRGPAAGFLVGEALSAVAGAAAAEAGLLDDNGANSQQPGIWGSPALLALWAIIMVLVAWKV